MPIMSPEAADALLANGTISPEQHAAIVGAPPPAMASSAATPPPTGGQAFIPFRQPVDDAAPPPGVANAFAARGLSLAPPAAPKPSEYDTSGLEPTGPILRPGEVPPPAPAGHVDVGHITANAPASAPRAAGGPAPKDPRLAALERDVAFGEKEKASIGREGDARAMQRVEEADIRKANADEAEQRAVLDMASRQREEQDIDGQVSKVNAAVADYANSKVDPDRYWHSTSTAQKIGMFIGVALGGFAEGFSNGAVKNRALEGIYQAIDKDIRAQEAAIDVKGKSVSQQRGALADLIAVTGSKQAGREAARVAALSDLQRQVDASAAKYGGAISQEQVGRIQIDIDKRLSDARGQLDTTLRNEAVGRAAAAQARADKLDDRNFQRGLELTKADQEQQKINDERRKNANGGQSAQNEDAAFRRDKAAVDEAFGQATKTGYDTRIGASLGSLFNTDNSRSNAAAVSQLVGGVKGTGDNSDKDLERLKAMVPQPGDDQATLNVKYGMLVNKLAQKHPAAAERAMRGQVTTTAPPGGK